MKRIGILGARSLVGERVLARLSDCTGEVYAFSRLVDAHEDGAIQWLNLKSHSMLSHPVPVSNWICLAPIWAFIDFFPLLEACGARRVVALSSTSVLTKVRSSFVEDVETANRLALAEKAFLHWAEQSGIDGVILRPTLIYGAGRDKNISEVVYFIRRWGFFPLFGEANGLRQPVHADDVAAACIAVLNCNTLEHQVYNISGAETLSYHAMIIRVFNAMGKQVRFFKFPLSVFKAVAFILRQLPRYKNCSAAMAKRMNQDLIFDSTDAENDFDYSPKAFRLMEEDLPP